MAFVFCDFGVEKNCEFLAKLQDGQRQFCQEHHRESIKTDPAYAEVVNAYNSDPILMEASETFRQILNEQMNALVFVFAPLDKALRIFEAEQRAARERQRPGIHAAEDYLDEAYRNEQMDEIY